MSNRMALIAGDIRSGVLSLPCAAAVLFVLMAASVCAGDAAEGIQQQPAIAVNANESVAKGREDEQVAADGRNGDESTVDASSGMPTGIVGDGTAQDDGIAGDTETPQDNGFVPETERKRFKLGLAVLFVAVASLFVMLLLISLIRLSRFQRRRLGLGKRLPRTEYIDAWSQYRLKDDPTESQEDESHE